MNQHGKITSINTKDKKDRSEESINTSQPVDIYFERINDIVQFDDDNKMLYTTKKTLHTILHTTLTSAQYLYNINEWLREAALENIWKIQEFILRGGSRHA